MALGTFESEVNAIEREVFVELSSDLPVAFSVAAYAALTKFTVMNILMAGQAFAGNRLIAYERK